MHKHLIGQEFYKDHTRPNKRTIALTGTITKITFLGKETDDGCRFDH